MVETKLSARDAKIEQHRRMAADVFREHVIAPRHEHGLFASWRCGKPGDSAYAFNITIEPGCIFVTGDIGVLVLERTENMLAWCRSAIRDVNYFAQKVPHEIPTTEWCDDVAREFIEELRAEENDEATESEQIERGNLIDDVAGRIDDGEAAFCSDLYDSGLVDGCDFPDLKNWKSRFLWGRECIRWFLDHSNYDPYTNDRKADA